MDTSTFLPTIPMAPCCEWSPPNSEQLNSGFKGGLTGFSDAKCRMSHVECPMDLTKRPAVPIGSSGQLVKYIGRLTWDVRHLTLKTACFAAITRAATFSDP